MQQQVRFACEEVSSGSLGRASKGHISRTLHQQSWPTALVVEGLSNVSTALIRIHYLILVPIVQKKLDNVTAILKWFSSVSGKSL